MRKKVSEKKGGGTFRWVIMAGRNEWRCTVSRAIYPYNRLVWVFSGKFVTKKIGFFFC